MPIADWFRPKWKHSSPARRAEAVRELGTDQREVILELARRDEDPGVRAVAIGRIDDPDVLRSLADADSSKAGQLAARRAREIWAARVSTADTVGSAREALAHLDDVDALVDIAQRSKEGHVRGAVLDRLAELGELARFVREGSDLPLRLDALARLDDPSTLRGLAIAGEPNEVAMAAIDAIKVVGDLEVIAIKARNKQLRARARKRATALRAEQEPDAAAAKARTRERLAEQLGVLAGMERLALAGPWTDEAALAAKSDWQRQWAALMVDDAELVRRFKRAVDGFERARVEALAQAEADRRRAVIAASEAAASQATERRGADPSRAERTPIEVGQPEPATTVRGPERASASPEMLDASSTTVVSESSVAAGPRERKAIDPEAKARKQAANAERLQAAVAELEAIVAPINRGQTVAVLRRSADAFERPGSLPPDVSLRSLTERYEAEQARVQALLGEDSREREWLEWSSQTKQQELADRADKLLAAADETEDLGAALQALQSEWKAVRSRPGGKSEALWQRFRTACDAVYEKVKLQREAEREIVKAQLERKAALCEQAETLADSTAWGEATAALKALQAEWKALGPTPRGQDRKLWTRFRVATDRFFTRKRSHSEAIDAEQAANLARKETIIAQIEAMLVGIVDDETWERAQRELEPLHRQWRDIGHVPRQLIASTRDRYKLARDAVFGRRDALAAQERAAAIEAARETAQRIAAVLDDASSDDAALLDAWGEVSSLDDDLTLRLVARCRARLVADPDAFAGSQLALAASLRRKQKLCDELDKLVTPRGEGDVAEQLQAALQGNALGRDVNTGTSLSKLEARWHRVGPTPGDEGEALDARWAAALDELGRAVGIDSSNDEPGG